MTNRLFTWVLCGWCALQLAGCALEPYEQPRLAQPRAETIAPVRADRPVVGLVLGAGGTRGFAHIGVLKVLEAEGLAPDVVVGVSSGAIVAALYAGGYDARALEGIALELGDYDLIDVTPFGPARVEGARLQDFINGKLGNRSIETLGKPFAVVAAEEKSRRRIVFNHGNTGLAVRASAAVPGMFWPVLISGVEYVDGGVTGRVPSPVARAMGADVVISVDVSWRGTAEVDPADIAIRPGVTRTKILDFSVKEQSIAAGEAAAIEAIPRIRAQIAAAEQAKQNLAALAR
jgi:NTE family protein